MIGIKAPTAKELGIKDEELFVLIQRLNGAVDPVRQPPPHTWVLHLKNTTPLRMDAVRSLPTASTKTHEFLERVMVYMGPLQFDGLRTSRTIKKTMLPDADIQRAVEMGKFEPCDPSLVRGGGAVLPEGVHGVNVFAVPELKGRRRLITEPHLNAVISKHEVPRVDYPTRLGRRQSLRYAKYMIQIDFEAFYDAIPIPETMRDKFVFRSRGGDYYRLRTLPTGARWSVAVGQAVTSVIVDIDTPVVIHTLIDNIMIAAHEGQEAEFVSAARRILSRIRIANLLTSPDREELASTSDAGLLTIAQESNIFLGEEYAAWDGHQRMIRNSTKTVAKIMLSLRATRFSCRTFASVVSLIMFALHTTRLNPARSFSLLRAYRGVYRMVHRGYDWDDLIPYLDQRVHDCLLRVGQQLVENPWYQIADARQPTYEDSFYDLICVTDASAGGWGAYVQSTRSGETRSYQQQWVHDLNMHERQGRRLGHPSDNRNNYPNDPPAGEGYFNAQHSAHAEPRAAELLLRRLAKEGSLPPDTRVALVTDHFPIVHAQRKLNGYGGIGRGYSLNKLFEYVHDLQFVGQVEVNLFYIAGPLNPADFISRNFGELPENSAGNIFKREVHGMGLPALRTTYSPLCEEKHTEEDGEGYGWDG